MCYTSQCHKNRMSAADHQRQLWEASQQFVRGEISAVRLEQIELAYSLRGKDAILGVAVWHRRWSIIVTFAMFGALNIALTVLLFFITQNAFSLVLLCVLVPLILAFRSTIRYLFPMDDKYYEQMALKIQEKRRIRKERERVQREANLFEYRKKPPFKHFL